MTSTCQSCKAEVEQWNEHCGTCGFHLVLEPDEARRARYLRAPSLGALLFTQGWALGARLYLLFIISLIPLVGFVALFVGAVFGRRLSWKHGSWSDWEAFTTRMKWLDALGIFWVCLLFMVYVLRRLHLV